MRILFDQYRHIVCEPYTRDNLHLMARLLGIKRCWFHGREPFAHYDLPKRMTGVTPIELALIIDGNMLDLEDAGVTPFDVKIECVSSREILQVVKNARRVK